MPNRWGNNGNSDRLYFWGSRITADGDCSHEIKRLLFLGRKGMTNLDSILKRRDITLDYNKESWVPKNWCFWTVVLEKTLESRLNSKKIQPSNLSILKEMSSEYSLEGLMLKLKLQSLGHLMWRTDSLEKTLMLGKMEGRRKSGRQMVGWHHWLSGHEFEWALGVGNGQENLVCCSPWGCQESDTTEGLNWTELNCKINVVGIFCITWWL